MANNTIQVKRTSTTGRTPNTTNSSNTQYIAAGELALNMTDGILYSSNGSVLIEVGANNTNQNVSNTLTVKAISANGSNGTSGQVLFTNGTAAYWNAAATSGGSSNIQVQNTTPSTPNNGVLYWNQDIGKLLIYYTDGTSNQWVEAAIGGGALSAKGSNTQIQFNDSGFANGSASFTYDKILNSLTAAGQNINSSGIYISGVVNSSSYTIGTQFVANSTTIFYGNSTANTYTGYNASTLTFRQDSGSVNNYILNSIWNANSGTSASGDFAIYTDDGFATGNNFIDMGINSSLWSNTLWTINGARDGYLYTGGGNLSIGTNTAAKYINFFTGGTLAANERMRIDGSGNVGIGNTAPADKLSVNGTGYFGANLTVINVYSTGTINAVAHIVGTSSIVNATGVYTTGTVNAATLSVGTNFIANATTVLVSNATGNVTIVPYGISISASGLGYVSVGNSTINSTLTSSSLTITNSTSTAQTVAGAVIVSNSTANVVVANVSGVTVTPNTGLTLGSFSAAANGYTWLPNGILVQWFRASITNAAAQAIAFPTTFPSNAYAITATCNSTAQTATVSIKTAIANGTHVLANSIGVNTAWNFVVYGN